MPHPKHGGWLGHMLPGWFFLAWSCWWSYSTIRLYMKDATKYPFASRTWFEFPLLKSVPVEPLCKVVFTFVGINGELWFGHESYRHALASTSFYLNMMIYREGIWNMDL